MKYDIVILLKSMVKEIILEDICGSGCLKGRRSATNLHLIA